MSLIKPICIIQSPLATRSGYGDFARDIARHIIELDRYDVKLVSLPWGVTPMNALDPVKDIELIKRIVPIPMQLTRQPELFIQISVPNEFQPLAKYNIGITAGIESTAVSLPWIQGCNRMNVIWTISNHSKKVFDETVIEEKAPNGQVMRTHRVTVPVEVLHNCVHTDIFRKLSQEEIPTNIKQTLSEIKERFCFLFVGHWLKGNMGEDRKNVGMLVKVFCETFKNTQSVNRPALILKTSGAGFSVIEREEILNKITSIKNTVGEHCPNVYLLSGELTEEEMNGLYNHPKVKAHVTFTKGEGFGRPLLEACFSQKPIIAPAWSGQLDFLVPELSILLPGELKQMDPSSVWQDVHIPESYWFNVDLNKAAGALMTVFKRYDQFILPAKSLAKINKEKFNYEVIKNKTAELLDKYVPATATEIPIKLPTLKKIKVEA